MQSQLQSYKLDTQLMQLHSYRATNYTANAVTQLESYKLDTQLMQSHSYRATNHIHS